ncbi:DUF4349 domain-containing protein [Aureivirga marina]|uniref:DUF4349 domain-containing protein n=1 Tax=Aureivirga marina TaxID=1182451 RepID=UPI0018CA2610|nr:DUF4349 domain-containing protein [Aureivirga marina]
MKKISILLLLVTLLVSCASMKTPVTHTKRNISTEQNVLENKRKIIYNAYINLSIKEFDSAAVRIENIIKSKKGFIIESSLNETKCRVPENLLIETLDELETLGKVRYKNIEGKDVSESYYDAQTRLENAEAAKAKYLKLLDKAVSVQDILAIEKEIERLNEKIELLKSKIENINYLSTYSTIRIQYRQKEKLGILGYVGAGLYHSVKWLFVRN